MRIRRFLIILPVLLTAVLTWMNAAVHTAPAIGSPAERRRLLEHLAFLEPRVHGGLDDDMQRLFPEGSVFTDVLYGSAWCGMLRSGPPDSLRAKAIGEARWAYAQLDRGDVKARFPALAKPAFGMFYAGWRAFLLGELMAEADGRADTALVREWDERAQDIATAFLASPGPFLESYPGQAWPAGAVVGVAALALHDRVSGTSTYEAVIQRWVGQVEARLDGRGMIPHAWDPWTDRPAEPARGSSQALMGCFLLAIDSALAARQSALFRRHFAGTRLGLPVVMEFPHGTSGSGEVDSGPVILGVGSSASLVGAGAFRANGALQEAAGIDATTEGLGLVVGGARKCYIFGVLPIADLFIVWSRTTHGRIAPFPARAWIGPLPCMVIADRGTALGAVDRPYCAGAGSRRSKQAASCSI